MFQIPFCLDEFDLALFYAFQKLGNPIWSPRNNRLHPLNEYIEEHSQEKLSTSDTSSLVTNIGHSHFSTTCDLISGHVIMYVLYMVAAQAIYNLALCLRHPQPCWLRWCTSKSELQSTANKLIPKTNYSEHARFRRQKSTTFPANLSSFVAYSTV